MKSFLKHILENSISFLARATIYRFKPVIIAVTGSVGKTSSKEAIWVALKNRFYSRKTSANFNNELGVPLSVIGDYSEVSKPAWFFWLKVLLVGFWHFIFESKNSYPQMLILEYGADKPGDIAELISIAKPHVAVISAIGQLPVHVENYPQGIEQVAREKGKLISELSVEDFAVLNSDDPTVVKLKEKTRAKVITFGFEKDSNVRISNFKHIVNEGRIEGLAFKMENEGASVPIILKNAFSISHAYAAACAACVGTIFDINLIESANAFILNYVPIKGRSVIIEGIKRTQIVDESYNSSPIALEMALKTLKMVSHTRKIAVLGDMMELGDYTVKAHEMIGDLVPSCADILITVGPRARFIAQRALKKDMDENAVFSFDEPEEAGLKLQELIKKGDLILIKGSRVVGLDNIVEEVKSVV